MKSTENFKKVIFQHLESVALKDSLFLETLKKPNKNIDDCVTYIMNTVRASGINGFEDEEIFSMAIHYYDEDELTIGNRIKCKVVTNHTVVLTEEEIQEAKKEAINSVFSEERDRMKKKNTAKKEEQKENSQSSLF
jgi:hypothetical protein